MAQDRGAKRLLARLARLASARIPLALAAVAALALGGCGGGESSDTQSTSATSTPAGPEASGKSASPAKAKANSQAPDSSEAHPPAGTPAGASGQGAGKHGKQVQLPKGEPEPTATPAQEANATVADIALTSPALAGQAGSQATLPPTYTCDGKDSWPALQWQGVPADSAELVLFAMNVAPVQGALFFDWAVAGLPPTLQGLEAGELPKGAVQGQNSFGKAGYSICPAEGAAETYVFALYALPQRLSPKQGFDPHQLREAVQGISANAGLLAVSYGR